MPSPCYYSIYMLRRAIPGVFVVALALIVPGLVVIGLQIYQARARTPQITQNRELVVHTFEVIMTAQALSASVREAERGQRGYLLTGEAKYLEIYQRAARDAPALLSKLKRLTSDNPEQQHRLPNLEHEVEIELKGVNRALQAGTTGGASPVRSDQGTIADSDTVAAIDLLVGAAVAEERRLLTERLARSVADESATLTTAIASAAVAFVAMIVGVVMLVLALLRTQRAETARRQGEQHFGLLVDGMAGHALYMLDVQGRVSHWNSGAERLKGYTADEIAGKSLECFFTEEDRAAGVPQRALKVAAERGKYELEGWRVRKDGSRFYASAVITALRDASGQPLGFAKITRDITERVQQQKVLEAANAALAQQHKMEALGQLTGGVAHDFNNLLHVIRNSVGIVLRRLHDVDPTVQKYLDMALQNADRASVVTQRLLAFSRQQPLDPRALDPNKLVAAMADLLRSALGERVALETVLASGLWTVSADPNQLETSILNLAVNSRDAMPLGGKLTIETANVHLDDPYAAAHVEVKPGQYVMIAVSDTGTGMSREVLEKAFDPFFTTKAPGHGTGLGLSQVFGFVKQSAGHVNIYTEPGSGTTVKVYLPRHIAAAEDLPKVLEQIPPKSGRGETILVVEDEADVRTFIADLLRELGYRVTAVADAHLALSELEKLGQVHLLFTDVGLPNGINGRQLADEVRKRWPDVKVLFTTGYARNAIVHHGRLDPGVELIVKPFTQSSLAAKVRKVLDGGRSIAS